jgi:uncharacterized protein YgbK (DUF1537 family)
LEQIRYFINRGGSAFEIDPFRLMEGSLSLDEIEAFMEARDGDVLIYSSQEPAEVRQNQARSGGRVSAVLEGTMGALAEYAVATGIKHLVVAGGETSGAVGLALNCTAFEIGSSLAPGVPLLYPLDFPEVRMVFKSGNFGGEDFFVRALATMKEDV